MTEDQKIPGLGITGTESGFRATATGGDGLYRAGYDGVLQIWTPEDGKVDFIVYKHHTLAYVKSALGYPAIYTVPEVAFQAPAKAVLMDLDGTSVRSETFWMWIIERTMAHLSDNPLFRLEEEDEPFVSGHSVSEHLKYCIDKYDPRFKVEEARDAYYKITDRELGEIMKGGGRSGAFSPAPGLKRFLLELKNHRVRIGLVTSGLYAKAWPEILSAFRTLELGDPLEFYDAIITAGTAIRPGQTGTLGELSPKPHPWLYSETAKVGLGISADQRDRVIGLEDSSAGVISLRLAGHCVIGIEEGNIRKGKVDSLCLNLYRNLEDALPVILG
jgi:beta-phosphoglucomutase